MQSTRKDLDSIPDQYLETIAHYLMGLRNLSKEEDLSKPQLRPSDIPIHVSMMTHFLIAGDRYRLLRDPRKPRIPAFVCALGAWVFAVCIVLPYPIYTTYLDLEDYKKDHFHGLGLCLGNLIDDIQQYMRGLFLITYIAPLTITAYIYVKASRELQNQEEPFPVTMFETRTKASSRHNSDTSNDVMSFRDGKHQSESLTTTGTMGISGLSTVYDLYETELDVRKEKRNQKYLIFMVSVFAILLCPLMVLRLAKLALVETYENSGHFDITYTMFVWLGFSSTVTTPFLYASWQMSRPTKERLKSYFRSSSRRLTLACEEGVRRSTRHVHDHVGVANVAYTQQGRADSVSVSNDEKENFRGGNLYHASPDLLVNASVHTE
ncbi:hypothetical protein PV327_009935 [Microctonus hyperodae]|uniref:G-protein coupled receptors family 1 profile domain-containing protein n=1 Tax=Microctonus hyperodae TaxID=165561 RepID=A0AA39KG50_MICHY|nr:hypothetical protein PV327_009935 [Microctonus hyperodae]